MPQTTPRFPPLTDAATLQEKQLRDAIAIQDRLIAEARHEMRRLSKRLKTKTSELERLKHQLVACMRKRAGQLQRSNTALRKELDRHRQTGAELQKSDVQFRALVESSIDHIFMLNEDGTFLFSNDRVQQFGLQTGSDLVGKRLQDVYLSQTCGLFREKLQEVFRSGEVVAFDHTNPIDNVTGHFMNTLYPICRDGGIWSVGGISRDISQYKIVEKQLFQAQKMEALGTLVAGVAHEINNPINLILFNLPLLEKIWNDLLPLLEEHFGHSPHFKIGGLTYAFIQEHLPQLIADMGMAAQRVTRIVGGLKDFSRKDNPAEKMFIDVNKAVENAAFLVGSTLKKSSAVLSLDLAPDLPLLHANLQNLEQIVVNLIINALQSIGHGSGKVHVTTSLGPHNKSIIIEVTDNGRGVNPAVAEKIFDPFVTDRQAVGGTGLGLTVSYNLVKSHNGEIYFKTHPQQGTTFTVVLPTEIKRRIFKVMVVDDDTLFRELLSDALSKKTDCLVEGFANGAEALIRLGSDPPDLLILDMFMPEIDGLGVCRAIKNELDLELTKVIIVTGFPEHPNLSEAARMGFTQIFTKPLALETFIGKVQEIVYGKSAG
jgi:PAS domain S-box-containing protein